MNNLIDFNPRRDNVMSALEKVKKDFISEIYNSLSNLEKIVDEQEKELEIREARVLPFKTYKTDEAAALLHISPQYLKALANRDEIPCSKIGRSFVFREAALIELQIRAERGEITLNTKEVSGVNTIRTKSY